jgi:hypothetical protein
MMFPVDIPDLPPQHAQVMIAQAGAADRTLGVCQVLENPARPAIPGDTVSAMNSMDPVIWVGNYFGEQERRQLTGPAQVSVVRRPAHGTVTRDNQGNYLYIPAAGYLGKDSATLLVEMGGAKILIVYSFMVAKVLDDREADRLCPPPLVRKISLLI